MLIILRFNLVITITTMISAELGLEGFNFSMSRRSADNLLFRIWCWRLSVGFANTNRRMSPRFLELCRKLFVCVWPLDWRVSVCSMTRDKCRCRYAFIGSLCCFLIKRAPKSGHTFGWFFDNTMLSFSFSSPFSIPLSPILFLQVSFSLLFPTPFLSSL